MKLKVCGMRENENILALSDLRPDYIGFIFWASSSRYVNSPTPKLDKKIKKTGVFVDANVEYVQDIIITHQLFYSNQIYNHFFVYIYISYNYTNFIIQNCWI